MATCLRLGAELENTKIKHRIFWKMVKKGITECFLGVKE